MRCVRTTKDERVDGQPANMMNSPTLTGGKDIIKIN